MELIQGYAEDDGNVGLDDIERWQDTHVLDFLSELDSKSSVDRLLKVRPPASLTSLTDI